MKAYYTIKEAVDTAETGNVYPQISGMRPDYNFEAFNSVHKLGRDNLPDFVPDLNFGLLDNKANPSDLLSKDLSPYGIVVSRTLKVVFEKFKLPDHQFYPFPIRGKIEYDYFWFHPVCNLSEYVDFVVTKFYSKDTFGKIEQLEINSIEDLQVQRPKIGYMKQITSDEIRFKNSFDQKLDLFIIGGGFDFNYYISQGLKDELIKEKITGISIEQVSNLK